MKRWLLGLLALAVCMACGDAEHEFSSYPCYIAVDNSVHNDAVLAQAMTQYAGVFATVTIVTHGGVQYFRFVSNQGGASESIFNAIDSRRSFRLGMNGALIVGYGNSVDGVFYAYDRECPNCFDPDAVPVRSKPLTVGTNGIAVCNVCKRQYDMNLGGVIVSGDAGKKLTRYPATTTGSYGSLVVN